MMAENNQPVFVFSDISKNCMFEKLYLQYQHSEYVDVSLKINSNIISVHSFLLAAESDYFKEKLKAEVSFNCHVTIDLSHLDVNFSDLEDIINYLYERKIYLDENNIKGILKICYCCSFKRLMLHGKQFLLTRIKPSNCLHIWRIARMLYFWDIEQMALILMQEIFWEESVMNLLNSIGKIELSYLMNHAPFPRRVPNAYRFLLSWLEEDFHKRIPDAYMYFTRFIPKIYLEYKIEEINETADCNPRIKNFLERVHSNKRRSEIITPFLDENWILVLKEREVLAVYFPVENSWTKIFVALRSKVLGILHNDIVILDERMHNIKMLNMRSRNSTFILIPSMDTSLAVQYFCSNNRLHAAYCTPSDKGITLHIKTHDNGWKISASSMFNDWKGDCKMKIYPDSKNFDIVFILITTRQSEKNDPQNTDTFIFLRYDSFNKRLEVVYESKSWVVPVNCLVFIFNECIKIVTENVNNPFIDQIKSGLLTFTSIIDQRTTISANIPIVPFSPPRPSSVTLSKHIPYFVAHFESVHYCSYSSKLFWLEHVAPFITRVFVYDTLLGKKWIELPPSPLSNLNEVTMGVFSCNSIFREKFRIDDEKQPISPMYYPFINMRIDSWNGSVQPAVFSVVTN